MEKSVSYYGKLSTRRRDEERFFTICHRPTKDFFGRQYKVFNFLAAITAVVDRSTWGIENSRLSRHMCLVAVIKYLRDSSSVRYEIKNRMSILEFHIIFEHSRQKKTTISDPQLAITVCHFSSQPRLVVVVRYRHQKHGCCCCLAIVLSVIFYLVI